MTFRDLILFDPAVRDDSSDGMFADGLLCFHHVKKSKINNFILYNDNPKNEQSTTIVKEIGTRFHEILQYR